MKENDKIIKVLAYDGKVSIICAKTTNLVEEARKIHDLTPTTTAVLGRVLTMASIMGSELKNKEDNITIQIDGKGPVGKIVVISNNNAKVKGYMQNPLVELPLNNLGKIDVGGAVGRNGYINIIKDIGLKDPYIGITPIVSGEIAEDFTKYFADSEQKPTAIALGVLVNKDGTKSSGGYRLNLMPDATEDIITKLEENINKAGSISSMLSENLSLEDIAKKVTGDNNLVIVENNIEPQYECDCSKEKFEKGLISLGKRELENIIKEDDKIETVCQFCNKKYVFNKKYIEELLKEMRD